MSNHSRRLVLDGPRRLTIQTVSPERLAPGHARIAVVAAGVCGSDVHGFAGLNARRPPGVVMGHEVGGLVAEVATDPEPPVRVGEFVVVYPIVSCGRCERCRAGNEHLCENRMLYGCALELPGGFADFIDVRFENLVRFSNDVPGLWASLVEPLAVGTHAVNRILASEPERALVTGGGPIGLACALAARRAGIEAVISEPAENRRRTASALGLEACDPGTIKFTDRPRLVFECVGLQSTLEAAVSSCDPGGAIVCVGVADPTLRIAASDLVIEERSLVGTSAYTRADFLETAAWVTEGGVNLDPMLGERLTLSDLPAAFEALAMGRASSGKTVMERSSTVPYWPRAPLVGAEPCGRETAANQP